MAMDWIEQIEESGKGIRAGCPEQKAEQKMREDILDIFVDKIYLY